MKCPKCESEVFKVSVMRRQRIKEMPQFLPVRITCARCGKHFKAYVMHEDLKVIMEELGHILGRLTDLVRLRELEFKARKYEKRWWEFWKTG